MILQTVSLILAAVFVIVLVYGLWKYIAASIYRYKELEKINKSIVNADCYVDDKGFMTCTQEIADEGDATQ